MSDLQKSDLEEGDLCPESCGGKLAFPEVEDCRCHISPPCGACVNNPLTCAVCGWEQPECKYESAVETPKAKQRNWRIREIHAIDLGDGKRIFDYDYDSSSGSTMHYRGKYEGPVTAADIINALGDGTFGHRGPTFHEGTFSYTKITD